MMPPDELWWRRQEEMLGALGLKWPPKFSLKLAQNLILHHALASQDMSADDRKLITEEAANLHRTVDDVERVLEVQKWTEPVAYAIYTNINNLMLSSAILGMATQLSPEAVAALKANWVSNWVKIPQKANSDKAAARKPTLKAAICQVAQKQSVQLIDSLKFAESIRDEVIKLAGVDSEARGYSASTIRKVIRSILKERKERRSILKER
jgi:hypothetical protein